MILMFMKKELVHMSQEVIIENLEKKIHKVQPKIIEALSKIMIKLSKQNLMKEYITHLEVEQRLMQVILRMQSKSTMLYFNEAPVLLIIIIEEKPTRV